MADDLASKTADELNLLRWAAGNAGDRERVRAVNVELKLRRQAQQSGQAYDPGPRRKSRDG